MQRKLQEQVLNIGTVALPDDLSGRLRSLVRRSDLHFEDVPNVAGAEGVLDDDPKLRKLILKTVIDTMVAAGQIDYLRHSGIVDAGYTILVEVHYYRSGEKSMIGFHKDSLGRTLFVNLNFLNDREIAGPEYIVNPPRIEQREKEVPLPKIFKRHLKDARRILPDDSDEVGASRLPAFGVVSFVDELIHHTTPLAGHRTVTNGALKTILIQQDSAKRLLSGSGVLASLSHQGCDEGAEEGFAAAPGVVHELEEAEIERQLLLRDAPVRAEPGAQQRPEPLHGVDVDLAEAVAILVAGVLAASVADRLVLIAPGRQAGVDVVLVGVDEGALGDGGLDDRLDRRLLHVGQHAQDHLPAALDQAEDGRLVLRQRAAARRARQPAAASEPPLLATAAGWPLCPATT